MNKSSIIYLSSAWISIEQSVKVSGIVYVFLGFVIDDWSCAVELANYGGHHWGIDDYRLFNYLSDFPESWLKSVYMYQDNTCEIIFRSDHSFTSYDQKSNALYMSIIG